MGAGFRRLAPVLLSGVVLSGCATFQPHDLRLSEINKSAGDYADQAILLNIVRAKRYEPLTFVTVTGLSGTSSITGSAGFSGFSIGPHPTTSPRNWLLGPNSVSRSGSNTFNVSVVDDPASFVALLSPISPATIAFFKNQGYPRELLFFLMVDSIREVDGRKVKTYENDPANPAAFGDFIALMSNLLRRGLVAELDVTAVPTGRSLPKSAFCFDPSLQRPYFARVKSEPDGAPLAPPPPEAPPTITLKEGESATACQGALWVEAVAGGGGSGGGGAGSGGPSLVAAPDGSAWLTLNGGSRLAHVTSGQPIEFFEVAPKKDPPKEAPPTAFPLTANGKTYEVHTRSVFGVYAYLGALMRTGHNGTDIRNLLPPDGTGSGGMLNIADRAPHCFAAVIYEGVDYCVPSEAGNTKRLFALLHQLQALNTAPSNAPTTLTVTNVP